jgi:hypothetical protein
MAKILLILATIAATIQASQHSSLHPQHLVQRALPTSITTDLTTISNDLKSLTATLQKYTGGVLDGLTVVKSERALTRDLESSTSKAESLDDLSEPDAQSLLVSIKKLVPDVEGTLHAIAEKESELRAAKMHGQAVSHVKKLEGMVERYGEALVKPMPEREEGEGKAILAKIMEVFVKTLSQLQ